MIDRFLAMVSPEPNTGCWLWMGAGDAGGYGHFGVSASTPRKAHRVSYQLFVGPVPKGLVVCHKCDVPGCVNPAHLFVGTHMDNARDRDTKGRTALGVKNGKSVLEPDDVEFIRLSGLSERAVARVLGVSRGTVNAVRSGRTWSHLRSAA